MTEGNRRWSLSDLDRTLRRRKAQLPEGSYTASLFKAGTERIAQKLGEEGVEVSIAATRFGITGRGRSELIGEIADLEFSLRVLMVNCGISFGEVREVLRQRNAQNSSKGGDKP